MSFKENLKAKIHLDLLARKLASTMRETPGQRRLDKDLLQRLLEATDFEHMKVRDLHLYVRPHEGEVMEVLVFDNELALYNTTVEDVAMRKSPEWKEMFSLRNVKRILNDHDVIVSKGKESVSRVHALALALLDLTYTGEDLELLVEDGRHGLESKSDALIQESFDLFFELLGFQAVSVEAAPENLLIFARAKKTDGPAPLFEHLILFDEEEFSLKLRKGAFSPQSNSDLAWVVECARGEEAPDLQGVEVFEFMARLALAEKQA